MFAKIGTQVRFLKNVSDENEYLKTLTPLAYDFCVKQFGDPPDPGVSSEISRDIARSVCMYAPILGGYVIQINITHHTIEQLCSSLGHEMYHRVTMRRAGAHREPWLNETLAYVASQGFLRDQGFVRYADYRDIRRRSDTEWFTLSRLRNTRKSLNPLKRIIGRMYPPEFGCEVERFAIALEASIGARALANLVGAISFESWVQQLSPELMERVEALIRLKAR